MNSAPGTKLPVDEEALDSYESCRADARRLCDQATLDHLRKLAPTAVIGATAIIWAQLALAWILAFAAPPIFWLISFVVICACVQAMQLWVHEASHNAFFRNKTLSELWATLFFAAPIGMSVHTYRRYHMTHHANLSTEGDLDRHAYDMDLSGWRAKISFFARVLTGYEGARLALRKYVGETFRDGPRHFDISLLATAAWNFLLLSLCISAGRWYLYPLLWAYPIIGAGIALTSVRSVSEHRPTAFAGSEQHEVLQPLVRTTTPLLAEKWLLYQAGFNYHLEHHFFPWIPAHNLPKLHRHLVSRGFYALHPICLQRSGIARFIALIGTKRGHIKQSRAKDV